jgi:AcrR family transcriptional regulator
VRIKHISELAGSSVGNIYQNFSSKEKLLQECFEWVDRHIARLYAGAEPHPESADDPEQELYRLWLILYRWLIAHPDETVFYYQYVNEPFFHEYEKGRAERAGSSFGLFQSFSPEMCGDNAELELLRFFSVNVTLLCAKAVVDGVLPDTPETERNIFKIKFNGEKSLLLPMMSGKAS